MISLLTVFVCGFDFFRREMGEDGHFKKCRVVFFCLFFFNDFFDVKLLCQMSNSQISQSNLFMHTQEVIWTDASTFNR